MGVGEDAVTVPLTPPADARAEIIRIARRLFAERGYGGTTLRAVAVEAGVDGSLVEQSFESKQGLFLRAVDELFDRLPTVHGELPGAGERLVRTFLGLWEDAETGPSMRAIFSSALSYDEAARLLSEIVTVRLVGPVVAAAGPPDPEWCVQVLSAQLIGAALMRFVLSAASLGDDEMLGRYFQGLLNGEITVRAGRWPDR